MKSLCRSEHVTSAPPHVIRALICYKSTDIDAQDGSCDEIAVAAKNAKRPKTERAKKSASRRKNPTQSPYPPGVRPTPAGQGKRGEQGYLAYLLRQAQAATRLTLERALADLGVTPPQFAVLTMLRAYPGLSGADLARVALLTPQTVGVITRNLERDRAIRKTPHPVHGRVLQWTLTRRGDRLLDQCRRPVRRWSGG